MPLFGNKKKKSDEENVTVEGMAQPQRPAAPLPQRQSHRRPQPKSDPPPEDLPAHKPKLVFQCQQAQGSPTGIISGFTNIRELYEKIAECYDFPASDILYCTLNTHKVNMNQLLGGQIGLDDFIFVHRKGQTKEVEIQKTDDALGLTITDNGAGYAFIKRIKEGSLIDRLSNFIQVGDHVEKIDGQNVVGCRHFEVARALKNIPKGSVFTLRLVEPLRAGFSHIGPRTGPGGSGKKSYGSGKETLRLRSKGPATVEEAPDDVVNAAVDKINILLETYMGINDSELATRIWEQGHQLNNPADFAIAVEESDLEAFGFSEDFIFDLWGAIKDAKDGRLKRDNEDTIF